MNGAQGSERLHGLDAVRGYALLLGVVFHAALSFLPGPQAWLVEDRQESAAVAAVAFASHMFRMTTFFLIAGFFGRLVLEKRGEAGFIRDRLKRIAVPLVVGWPIVLALIVAAMVYGAMVANGGELPKRPPAPPPGYGQPGAFPLTHLWFLYVLLWFYAATLATRALVRRLDGSGALRVGADRVVAGLVNNPLGVLALAAPVVVAFHLHRPWIQWFGVPTPDQNLIPTLPAAVQYGLAFGFGWLLHRQPALLQVWRERWLPNLAVAAALTIACLVMLGLETSVAAAEPGWRTSLYAALYGLGVWTWTFAVIGLALRFLSGHSPMRRYIADSSYWIYIVHLPLVLALQAWVSPFGWPAEVKIVVVLAIALPLLIGSYQLLVRHTFLGAVLNGARAPRPGKATRESVA